MVQTCFPSSYVGSALSTGDNVHRIPRLDGIFEIGCQCFPSRGLFSCQHSQAYPIGICQRPKESTQIRTLPFEIYREDKDKEKEKYD